jgi:hypothetical protein
MIILELSMHTWKYFMGQIIVETIIMRPFVMHG